MSTNRPALFTFTGLAAVALALGMGACTGAPGADSQAPTPGSGAIDTRTNTFPGSVIPSVGGSGNGGGISGGGAGTGSFGGGR